MKLCFFFFFFLLSYIAAGKTKLAGSHNQRRRVPPTRGHVPSWPAPITPLGVKSGSLPSFLGVPWKIPKGWTLEKSPVGLQWTWGKSSPWILQSCIPLAFSDHRGEAMLLVSSAKRTTYLPKTWLSWSHKALGGSRFITRNLTGVLPLAVHNSSSHFFLHFDLLERKILCDKQKTKRLWTSRRLEYQCFRRIPCCWNHSGLCPRPPSSSHWITHMHVHKKTEVWGDTDPAQQPERSNFLRNGRLSGSSQGMPTQADGGVQLSCKHLYKPHPFFFCGRAKRWRTSLAPF